MYVKAVEELGVEFNFQAKETYYVVYSRFNSAVENLHRHKDEIAFQQNRTKYGNSLKSELEKLAIGVLQKNQHVQEFEHLKKNLVLRINDYLHDFLMKSESV